jgi:hypothetical protein
LAKRSKKRAGKQVERPIFDAIRKPSAPPQYPLGRAKPEERAHPAERKVKHKQRTDEGE